MRRSNIDTWTVLLMIISALLLINSCKKGGSATIKEFPVNDLVGITSKDLAKFDEKISADGAGSARFELNSPSTIKLYETGDLDVEDATVIYSAKVKTEGLKGEAYLEMWCAFKDKGEYFSRGLDNALEGTNEWTLLETPFSLKKGENPDNIKLNLVVNGTGKVWIDDLKLIKAPLNR